MASPETKAEVLDVVYGEAETCFVDVLGSVTADVEAYLDMEAMVVGILTTNKAMLVDLFLHIGANEFAFIRRSGFVLGFLFGIVQMLVWIFYKGWWVLPLAGFAVGWATNWIALKVIFRPVHPHPMCAGRWNFQGLFLKRQDEVSAEYARMVATNLITPRNVFAELAGGPRSAALYSLLLARLDTAVDAWAGSALPLTLLFLGTSTYARLKRQIAHRLFVRLPTLLAPAEPYAAEAMDLEARLAAALRALPPASFEQMLHPIFEEDEIILIVVGAFLGLTVGAVQAVVQLTLFGT